MTAAGRKELRSALPVPCSLAGGAPSPLHSGRAQVLTPQGVARRDRAHGSIARLAA